MTDPLPMAKTYPESKFQKLLGAETVLVLLHKKINYCICFCFFFMWFFTPLAYSLYPCLICLCLCLCLCLLHYLHISMTMSIPIKGIHIRFVFSSCLQRRLPLLPPTRRLRNDLTPHHVGSESCSATVKLSLSHSRHHITCARAILWVWLVELELESCEAFVRQIRKRQRADNGHWRHEIVRFC